MEGYLKNVLEMPRRKSPADPGARRVLAELAYDTREKIRECRLAMEYYARLADGAGAHKVPKLRRKIATLRDEYRSGRATVESAESMLDVNSLPAMVLRSYGISPSPAGIPPERWLPTAGYRAIMARRQRLAASGRR